MQWLRRSVLVAILLAAPAFAQQINIDTQLKGSRLPMWGTDSGAANAYSITTVAPLGPSLRTGSRFMFVATHANTSASTLAVDGGSTIAIKKNVSTALASGDIALNQVVEVTYDGTNFQIVGNGAVSFSSLPGSLVCSQMPALTGDINSSAGSCSTAYAGTVPVNKGGTNQTSYTKGDLLCASGSTTLIKLGVGTNANVLTADSTQTCGVKWTPPSFSGSGSGCSTGLPGSVCAYYLNDTGTGTTTNHLVRFINAGVNQKAIRDFTNSDPPGWASGLIGVVQSGAGTSGSAEICFAGRCQCDFDAAATQGDFVDIAINTSNAPKCHANGGAGVNETPDTHTFFAKVHTTIGAAGVTDIDILPVMAQENSLTVFGAGNVPVIVAGGQHFNISPMGIDLSGGTATSVAPLMSTLTGYRVRSQSNVSQYFDIYGFYSNGGTDDSELVFDESGSSNNGRAFVFKCVGCGSGDAAAHYSPDYNASFSGSNTIFDTTADVWNLTLTGNTAITYQRPRRGHVTWWNICQDATGGRTFSVKGNGGSDVFGGGAPAVSATANACTIWSAVTTNNSYANPTLSVVGGGSGGGGGGSGTVTSIATTSPITGGTITTSGTIACATCVVASSPGAGIAHFAGSTQTVTSSAVVLSGSDVTGNLGVSHLNSGTSASSSTFWRGDGTWATASGSTGISSATANGAMYATAATTGTSTGALTNGQVLIGDTGNAPQAATLTAGSGVTITNAAHSITIAASGGGGSGTVNSGGPRQMTYYNSSGTTVDGLISPLNVDIPPASANAMDDEFNGSTLNTTTLWTATNIGASTATESNGIVSLGSITTNNAFSLKSYLQNVPGSTPWTVTIKFAFNSTINGCNKYAGLVLSDGTKYEIEEVGDLNNGTPELGVQSFTTSTAGPSNLAHYDRVANFNSWIYLQVQNDGTNLNYTTSADGITFIKLYSEAKGANFSTAPTKVGIGGDASQTSCVQSAEYDWFRRTQ